MNERTKQKHILKDGMDGLALSIIFGAFINGALR